MDDLDGDLPKDDELHKLIVGNHHFNQEEAE